MGYQKRPGKGRFIGPFDLSGFVKRSLGFGQGTLPVSYILTADPGTFALTGIDAALTQHRVLAAQPGAFVLAGVAAVLSQRRSIVAAPGAFVLTGVASALSRRVVLAAGTGVFTEAGQAANLVQHHVLTAETGAFVFTGVSNRLVASYGVLAGTGAFALAMQAAALVVSRRLSALPGSFILAWQDANLSTNLPASYVLTAQPGSFAVAGQDAGGVVQIAGNGTSAGAARGSFAVTQSIPVRRDPPKRYRLLAETGSFGLAGSSVRMVATFMPPLVVETPPAPVIPVPTVPRGIPTPDPVPVEAAPEATPVAPQRVTEPVLPPDPPKTLSFVLSAEPGVFTATLGRLVGSVSLAPVPEVKVPDPAPVVPVAYVLEAGVGRFTTSFHGVKLTATKAPQLPSPEDVAVPDDTLVLLAVQYYLDQL